MKLIKDSNGDFIIADDNGVSQQVVHADEVIDGAKLAKYQRNASNMDNKKLLDTYVEMNLVAFVDREDEYPGFETMFECIYHEIIRRMS